MAKSTAKSAKKAAVKKPAPAAKSKTDKVKKAEKPVKASKSAPIKPSKSVKPTKIEKAQVKPVKAKSEVNSEVRVETLKAKKIPIIPKVTDPSKAKTVVSMLEVEAPADDAKVEKVSKIKPVKVERGNSADEKAKWLELNKKYGKEKAITYKMTESYSPLLPLQHKVLGWGFILTNENDRLEVLFETGIRMLISNYKS